MKIISKESGYAMAISGNLPTLTKTYIRKNVVDKEVWADLHATNAHHHMRMAIRRHLDGLGANITDMLMAKLNIDDDLLAYCRKKYALY